MCESLQRFLLVVCITAMLPLTSQAVIHSPACPSGSFEIGHLTSEHLYINYPLEQCLNDPVNNIDPLGLAGGPPGEVESDILPESRGGMLEPSPNLRGARALMEVEAARLAELGAKLRRNPNVPEFLLSRITALLNRARAPSLYENEETELGSMALFGREIRDLAGEAGMYLPKHGGLPVMSPREQKEFEERLGKNPALPGMVSENKAALWKVGRHGDMPSPRPDGYESHHGVNSVWMEENVAGYTASDAPAVLMKNDPFHNATRGVFNQIRNEMAVRQGVSPRDVDWSRIPPGTAWRIAEEQFQAAKVPADVQADYFRQFNQYLDSLR